MAKIKVLDKHVAELIAAGEVVERPASVIKELVENSVDSGASLITVEIRNGGVTFMRVTDNGCGIQREEVTTAFLRHATSKVSDRDDLEHIMTLGFRGEALASVAAVSRVELLTKTKRESSGTAYSCSAGESGEPEEAGCPDGTTIIVRDIFYNTPARMKFLKKDSTEGNAVAGVVEKLALSHPEISVRFIRDGKEALHTPGDNKLISAIYSVYGKEFASGLMPVDYELSGVKVKGYVSRPAYARPNRSMQSFFINGRFVRSRTAAAALEEAFKGSIMVGKFPSCVLHLEMNFEAVDVNVHPAKLEVRFTNERPVFDSVYHAVKTALQKEDGPKEMPLASKTANGFSSVSVPGEKARQMTFPADATAENQREYRAEAFRDGSYRAAGAEKATEFESFIKKTVDITPQKVDNSIEEKPARDFHEDVKPGFHVTAAEEAELSVSGEPGGGAELPEEGEKPRQRVIGEAFGTYIILEYGSDALMLIDKHAAHERLIYERLRKNADGAESQMLLQPVAVTLDKAEFSAVTANLELLNKAGFEVEEFGSGTVLVRSAPMLLSGEDAASAVMEIAGYLSELKRDITTEHLSWIYHNVACRAAIKAGDETSDMELSALAAELENDPGIRYCPHGRPVYIKITKKEIEKQFGRI